MSGRIRIAAHRGRFGGNVVENTLEAFEAALNCGADIVEMDVRKTRDGEFVLFHDPSPARLLGLPGRTEDYSLDELRGRPLLNVIGEPSASRVTRLDEALAALKGRCMINLDQCWGFIDEVYARVRRMGMEDQALIKGKAPYDGAVRWLRKNDYVPQFIPIVTCDEETEGWRDLPERARIPIVEVFFHDDAEAAIQPGHIARIHDAGAAVWVNALTLSGRFTLCGWHDDNTSVTGRPEEGWGWLIDRGADIIQTDWTGELARYIAGRGNAAR